MNSAWRRVNFAFCLIALAVGTRSASAVEVPVPAKIDFNRDVRPILSDTCYACHGPDKNARKADLRLDMKEGLFAKTKEGVTPIVAGKPVESEVIRRITTQDADDHMPPKKFNKELTPRQIAVLEKWIEQGAEFKGHWAYLPIVRPDVPPADQPGFVRNPIDNFILAKLTEQGLKPSPPTDPATLCRRVYFDLTGLPPAKADVDAFINDKSPDAYEKLVDRLLASDRYGERMAIVWLDLVRYADSVGYHSDNPMNVYPYREYVVRSFIENKPFDQFTIEQLAGDLLPNATTQQKIASTYNRLLQTTEEGGAQPREYMAKYASDRVRNISAVWMAQTLGCAECHDHKFDPWTQKDFYSMEAFFADIQEPAVGGRGPGTPVGTPQQEAQLKQFDDSIAAAKQKLTETSPELAAAQTEWEKLFAQSTDWKTLDLETMKAANGTVLTKDADGAIKASGIFPAKETYTLTAKTDLRGITALRLEAINDPAFPAGGPGVSANGNFVLSELHLTSTAGSKPEAKVELAKASADFEQNGFAVAGAIDNNLGTGWAVMPDFGKTHTAIFQTAQPIAAGANPQLDGPLTLTIVLDFQSVYPQHQIGKFRVSVTSNPNPAGIAAIPVNVQAALALPAEQRSEAQKKTIADHYRSISPLMQPVRDEVARLEKEKASLAASLPSSLVTVAGGPREIRILPRGNWLSDDGAVVLPAVPASLPQPDPKPGQPRMTRLDLAQWLVRKDNPLPARAFVNRLWKICYGTGISKTLEDMGSQGEWPIHPELLDWLSSGFQESWDVKKMMKLLVTSGTYRQPSRPTAQLKEIDPFNRLLARQSAFRLDAEMVRDNALAVSGLLINKIGGKSVFPYQPPGYWFALNFPAREWQNGSGDDLYRRGIYTHWQRTFLQPSLLAFDAPSREEAVCERTRSNIPQQALALLNDTTYVEASRMLAQRIIKEGGAAPTDRIKWAFENVLSRDPNADETRVLAELQAKHLANYQQDVDAATKILKVGAKPADASIPPAELASWTSVARTILNLHETITRR